MIAKLIPSALIFRRDLGRVALEGQTAVAVYLQNLPKLILKEHSAWTDRLLKSAGSFIGELLASGSEVARVSE